MAQSPYSFFDDIICINLKSRPDRKEYAVKTLNGLNIPFRFYIAEKSPYGGIYGCFESHINVIKEAYNKGANNILIFEDDVKTSPSYSEAHIKNAIAYMKTNEWDIFYLGYFPFNTDNQIILNSKKLTHHIYKFSPWSTCTYCLNRKTMEKILSVYKQFIDKIPVDYFYTLNQFFQNNVCYVPMLFSQKSCFKSDIESKSLLEYVARKHQCIEDTYNLCHKSTIITYNRDVYFSIIMLTIIAFLAILFYTIGRKSIKKSMRK